jgi:hypothetical protein
MVGKNVSSEILDGSVDSDGWDGDSHSIACGTYYLSIHNAALGYTLLMEMGTYLLPLCNRENPQGEVHSTSFARGRDW